MVALAPADGVAAGVLPEQPKVATRSRPDAITSANLLMFFILGTSLNFEDRRVNSS